MLKLLDILAQYKPASVRVARSEVKPDTYVLGLHSTLHGLVVLAVYILTVTRGFSWDILKGGNNIGVLASGRGVLGV